MNEKLPTKISRRAFLSKSGKMAVGVVGVLAGGSGLFYYQTVKQRERSSTEKLVKLGELSKLTAMQGIEKVSYKVDTIEAGVTKSINAFVYVNRDIKGNLLIMSPRCTHLSCIIEPVPEAERGASNDLYFRCPCHGAEFDLIGNSVNGVVLQGLDTYKPIMNNGIVYIDISLPIKGPIASSK